MFVFYVVILSIIFQAIAAILALRLSRTTGRHIAWLLIACAMTLQTFRRIITLKELITRDLISSHVAGNEILGLGLSLLMVFGVIAMGRLFQAMVRNIAERKQAESQKKDALEALKKEDAELKLILDSSPIIIFYKDREGRFLRVNKVFTEALDMPEDNFKGKTVFDLYSADIAQRMTNDDQQVLRSGKPRLNIIEQYESKHGRRWVQTDKIPTCDVNGKVTGLVGFAQDITERKQAAEELRETEKTYKHLLESSRDAIMTLEPPSWRFTSGNLSMLNMFKANNEREFILHYPWTLSPDRQPDGRISDEKAKEMIEIAMREGTNFFEWVHKRMDGSVFPAEVFLSRVEKKGKIFLQATVRDITVRKQAEEALRESEQKFKKIFDSASDGVLITDVETKKFILGNNAICRMLGYSHEDIINLGVNDIHPREELNNVIKKFERQAKGETAFAFDVPIKRKDGTVFYVDTNSFDITISGKKYIGGIFRDITERKQAELKYETILKTTIDCFYIVDARQGNILEVNDSYCSVIGYSRNELLKMNLKDIEAQESPEEIAEHTQRIIKQGSDHFETRHRAKDGKIIDLETSVNYIKESNIVFVFMHDITERKKMEKALKNSEQFQSSVFNSIQDGISVLDTEMRILKVNAVMEKWYAYAMPLIGKKCYEVYHKKNEPCKICPTIKTLASGQAAYELVPFTGARGEQIGWMELYSFPFIDTQTGKLQGVIEYVRDVTERKKAEQEKRESEEKFRQIAENVNEVFWMVSPDWQQVYYISPAYEKIWQKSTESLYNNPLSWIDCIIEEDKAKFTAAIEKMHTTGSLVIEFPEYRILRRDNSIAWIKSRGRAIKDETGNIIKIVGISEDITEQKNIEQLRNNLIRDVSHGLKTPIAMTEMAIKICQEGIKNKQQDAVNSGQTIALNNIARLRKDVENMMQSFTMDIKKTEMLKVNNKETCSLKEAVNHAIELTELMRKPKGIEVNINIPEAAGKVRLSLQDMTLIMDNLFSNAVKFTEKGRITVTGQRKDKYVELIIKDTGCGIEKSQISKVFNRFYKRHPAIEGTGLGLTICKELIELYKGTITAESEGLNKGTTIIMMLPAGD